MKKPGFPKVIYLHYPLTLCGSFEITNPAYMNLLSHDTAANDPVLFPQEDCHLQNKKIQILSKITIDNPTCGDVDFSEQKLGK